MPIIGAVSLFNESFEISYCVVDTDVDRKEGWIHFPQNNINVDCLNFLSLFWFKEKGQHHIHTKFLSCSSQSTDSISCFIPGIFKVATHMSISVIS